jgi:hypothetical protein
VEILPPISASEAAAESLAMALRDRAREAILRELGEPDLTRGPENAPTSDQAATAVGQDA